MTNRLFALLLILLPAASAGAEPHGTDQLAAKLAIQELIAEYAFRWDSKRSAEFAGLFTEDGSMERMTGRRDGGRFQAGRKAGYPELCSGFS